MYKNIEQVKDILRGFNSTKYTQNVEIVTSGTQLDDINFLQNAFYNYLIYYPITKFSQSAFTSPYETTLFFSTLDKWSEDIYTGNTNYNYIIVKPDQLTNFKDGNRVVFKTNKYLVLSTK
jgi:hypothetical protein